jgi:hypothetical protein
MYATGRTATPGETCTDCPEPTPAVSTFLVRGKVHGSACESHIIAVHRRADEAAKPQVYKRGTKTGRVNSTHVKIGTRILVRQKMDTSLMLADTKTGAQIATITAKYRGGGYRCYTLITDMGRIVAPAAMCMHTMPDA